MSRFFGVHSLARVFGLFLAHIIASGHASQAELLYFARGGQIQHRATIQNGFVQLDTPAGRFRFPESDFSRIVPGYSPAIEWPARAEKAQAGTTEDRLTAAWWALENGLVTECSEMLREAHRADGKNPLCRRLVSMLDQLEPPLRNPDTTLLVNALGVRCETATGRHILLLHQHDHAEAGERIEHLERVLRAYYLFLTWNGVSCALPSEKLTSVYLKERSDYLAFLKSHHAGAFSGTFGYYHPTMRTVIAYDLRGSGRFLAERRVIEHLPEAPGLPDERRRDLERRRLLFEMEYRALDHGTVAHELIHQLVAVSGLAPKAGQFPHWLHEGLACQFEVVRGGRWAGICRAHDLRMADWRGLTRPLDLASLINDNGFGHGYQQDLYAKSWAIVYYLLNSHPETFWAYVDMLRRADAEATEATPRRSVDDFRAAFGSDWKSLESDWRDSMRGLSTPLEDHMPQGIRRSVKPVSTGRD
jgi:hypothetical protein